MSTVVSVVAPDRAKARAEGDRVAKRLGYRVSGEPKQSSMKDVWQVPVQKQEAQA